MKIFNAQIIKELDSHTIKHEPIASIDLMERASFAFCDWFQTKFLIDVAPIKVVCGLGNNGGDGLAIARILHGRGFDVTVFVLNYSENRSQEFKINFERFLQIQPVNSIIDENEIPFFAKNDIIIDAIFGIGLSRPTEGIVKKVIEKINEANSVVISVDIASGLFADHSNNMNDIIVKPTFTITFQLPKLAFLLPQNTEFVGEWHRLNIGLSNSFIEDTKTNYFYTESVSDLIKTRSKFSNKGTYGHALIIAGSFGMMGAAILSAKSCLRSGVGKLTMNIPKCGYEIMQISVPEAMVICQQKEKYITEIIDYKQFNAIGVGPGIGNNSETVIFIQNLLNEANCPLVIDADALNIIAENNFHKLIPPNSILTPHPKEFERLLGKTWQNDYQKLDLLFKFTKEYQVIVVLKGANTTVALPDGSLHFNSTGNAGMAKGGTGDVLTGMIAALLAQKYSPEQAAIIGVFEHGKAGDKAALKKGMTAMLATDLIDDIRF